MKKSFAPLGSLGLQENWNCSCCEELDISSASTLLSCLFCLKPRRIKLVSSKGWCSPFLSLKPKSGLRGRNYVAMQQLLNHRYWARSAVQHMMDIFPCGFFDTFIVFHPLADKYAPNLMKHYVQNQMIIIHVSSSASFWSASWGWLYIKQFVKAKKTLNIRDIAEEYK